MAATPRAPWFPQPVWWADAKQTHVNVIGMGQRAGDALVDADLALVLSGDSSYAIEGSRDELIRLLIDCLKEVWTCSETP